MAAYRALQGVYAGSSPGSAIRANVRTERETSHPLPAQFCLAESLQSETPALPRWHGEDRRRKRGERLDRLPLFGPQKYSRCAGTIFGGIRLGFRCQSAGQTARTARPRLNLLTVMHPCTPCWPNSCATGAPRHLTERVRISYSLPCKRTGEFRCRLPYSPSTICGRQRLRRGLLSRRDSGLDFTISGTRWRSS